MNILAREPVRAYLYSVVAAVVALLVALGWLHVDLVPGILGLAATVLAVEVARSQVTPVPKEPPTV